MTEFQLYVVCALLMCCFPPIGTFPHSGPNSRSRRYIHCKDTLEYAYDNTCCLYCPAGKRLTSHCTRDGGKGTCEECDDGTYIEHPSDLEKCFKCAQCRPEQDLVKPCTHTQNTECQCKLGGFCHPDEACEVCMKCSRCKEDEEIVRNCTPTADTECRRIQAYSASASASAWVIVAPLIAVALVIGVVVVAVKRRHNTTGSQRNPTDEMKPGLPYNANCSTEERMNGGTHRHFSSLIPSSQLVRVHLSGSMEDERQGLCDSLSSSNSNSQHSLTAPPRREEEGFLKLVPVNGDESLRKCFEYFEEVDSSYHNKFFRHIGIADNVIKSKAGLPYDDRIHELLNQWMEKVGLEASLSDLLKALLDLSQRRTAEAIRDNAINNGHYVCEK